MVTLSNKIIGLHLPDVFCKQLTNVFVIILIRILINNLIYYF